MLNTSDSLLIAFEYYQLAISLSSLRTSVYRSLLKDYAHFSVLMNCLIVVKSPVFIVICKNIIIWMGQGTILVVFSIQKWDTGFSGGMLKF
jgi:hypothetical protein